MIIRDPRVWEAWILNHTIGLLLPTHFYNSKPEKPASFWDWLSLFLLFLITMLLGMLFFI